MVQSFARLKLWLHSAAHYIRGAVLTQGSCARDITRTLFLCADESGSPSQTLKTLLAVTASYDAATTNACQATTAGLRVLEYDVHSGSDAYLWHMSAHTAARPKRVCYVVPRRSYVC